MDRRQLLSAAALGALAFQVDGAITMLTPREARAREVPFRLLSEGQATLVDALGDAIAPGAAEAGLAHYLDQQLSAELGDCLLMARYMDLPDPLSDFYMAGFAAVQAACRAKYGEGLEDVGVAARHDFVGALSIGDVAGWNGPPAPFFYFVFRSDAVDVTYGTMEGFARLGVPYLAHIEPEEPW